MHLLVGAAPIFHNSVRLLSFLDSHVNAVACRSIQKGDDPKGFNTAVAAMMRHGATNGGCFIFFAGFIYIYAMLYLIAVWT